MVREQPVQLDKGRRVSWLGRRRGSLVLLLLAAGFGWCLGATLPWGMEAVTTARAIGRPHDCADLLAGAFVYREEIDIPTSVAAVLGGRLVVLRRGGFGRGAWRCLSADRQDELAAAGIVDDVSLSAAARSNRRAYAQIDRIGVLPQADGLPVYVFRLSRTVTTHDVVSDQGPAAWIERQLLGYAQRPKLQQVNRTESVLMLVRLDGQGKVDRFGFVGQDRD